MTKLDCTIVDSRDTMDLLTQVNTNRQEEKMSVKAYPQNYISWESGCKVGWITYSTRKQAEECAKVASENSDYLASMGYDFGYQVPGAIAKVESGWMVTIP
jgi:hypothetical protein